jgi:E3 ubiquitin-protein ligase synoviolin
MEQIPHPGPTRLFLLRISAISLLLLLTDLVLFRYFLDDNLYNGVSAMLLFTTEYMILIATISGTFARFVVNVEDMRRAAGRADAPTWEMKSRWVFYIDLLVGECLSSIASLSPRPAL